MNNTTHCISGLISDIRTCLEESDFEAARFLREGVLENLRHGPVWLTAEEEDLLASY